MSFFFAIFVVRFDFSLRRGLSCYGTHPLRIAVLFNKRSTRLTRFFFVVYVRAVFGRRFEIFLFVIRNIKKLNLSTIESPVGHYFFFPSIVCSYACPPYISNTSLNIAEVRLCIR